MDATQIVELELALLADDTTQTRAGEREHAIVEYLGLLQDGEKLDPAVVFHDGKTHFLATGRHRREAYRRFGQTTMPCEVRRGDRWQAIEVGIEDNKRHRGERLSNADKQHNVQLVLREQPKWSDGKIAELVGVHHTTVSKHRAMLVGGGAISESSSRLGRDGREYLAPHSADAGAEFRAKEHETRADGHSHRGPDPRFGDNPISVETIAGKPMYDSPAELVPATVQGVDGSTVPRALPQVFEVAPEFDEQRHKLTGVKSWITQRRKHPAGSRLEGAAQRIITDIDNADRELKFTRPYCSCPYCKGEPQTSCNACKGTGWITEPQYGNVPPENKKGVVFVQKRSGGKSLPRTISSDVVADADLIVVQLEAALTAFNNAQPDAERFEAAKKHMQALAVLLGDWRNAAL